MIGTEFDESKASDTPMTATTTSPAPATPPQAAFARIRWMFIWAVVGSFTAIAWDAWWHTQVPFDGFFSPPHVFAYAVALSLVVATNATILDRDLRRWFGRGFRVPILPYPVPGALVLLAGSLALLGFAGLVLDNIWHSAFGLNETRWSFPHAMIGWSLLLMVLGFAACRLALGELGWAWKLALGWLIIVMATESAAGPITANNSPAIVYATSQIPVFQAQEETRHLFKIYLEHNLTRTNPLIIVLAPLGAAAGLAFVRRMDARPHVMLGLALLISISGDRNLAERLAVYSPELLADPVNYAPLPLIALAGVYTLLRWRGASERVAWGIGGLVFGLLLNWTFVQTPGMGLLTILSAGTAVVGAAVGNRVYDIVRKPYSWRTIIPLIALGVGMPLLTGCVDLYLRLITSP
jgi:hypothetical protein